MKAARDVVATSAGDQSIDVKEEIFVGPVVLDRPDIVCRDAVQRHAEGVCVRLVDDPLGLEHHEMGVVNRHQRRQQQLLGVFEIFVEDVGDVFGGEPHR